MKSKNKMNKTLNLIIRVILSHKSLIKKYKLIGFFGTCIKPKGFFDIDLITIGNNKVHINLKNRLRKELAKKNLKMVFFKTVKRQPISKNKNDVLIHDLHYSDLKELYKKEWKDVINEIKISAKVIYGSKKSIKTFKVYEKDFYSVWLKWVKKNKTKEDYSNFKRYIQKIIPLIYKRHPKLKIEGRILKILKKQKNWKIANKEIISILKEEIKKYSKNKIQEKKSHKSVKSLKSFGKAC